MVQGLVTGFYEYVDVIVINLNEGIELGYHIVILRSVMMESLRFL